MRQAFLARGKYIPDEVSFMKENKNGTGRGEMEQ